MKLLFLAVFLSLIAMPVLTLAQDTNLPPAKISLTDPFGCQPVTKAGDPPCFMQVLQQIIGRLLQIAYPLLAGMVFYGGMQMMFARGVSEKYNAGKKTILYAVIGFAVILVSQGIAFILADLIKLK